MLLYILKTPETDLQLRQVWYLNWVYWIIQPANVSCTMCGQSEPLDPKLQVPFSCLKPNEKLLGFNHCFACFMKHTLYWIPDKSHIRPQIPSKASTSRIKCPLPIPPNEGLQDISPNKTIFRINVTLLHYRKRLPTNSFNFMSEK